MIADRLRALVAELRTPRPTWDDNVTFVSERDTDIADRLDQILAEDAGGWCSMDSAPRDGTRILAYGPTPSVEPTECECRETWWELYRSGSIAKAEHDRGAGPSGSWAWREPVNSWFSSWRPTHWRPLPYPPPQEPQP